MKKYLLKYKTIISSEGHSLISILDSVFNNFESNRFSFIDNKNITHDCRIKLIKKEDGYFYGRFGEIKSSNVENGVAIFNDEEFSEADFKYHVQFLINSNSCEMDFIYNARANCFCEAFQSYVVNKCNLAIFSLVDRIDNGLEQKIRRAKKIKYVGIKNKNIREINGIFNDLYDLDTYKVEVKVKFKKTAGLNIEKITEFYSRNKNNNQYSISFIDEDNNSLVKNFADNAFFKTKTLEINPIDITNDDFIFNELKRKLDDAA